MLLLANLPKHNIGFTTMNSNVKEQKGTMANTMDPQHHQIERSNAGHAVMKPLWCTNVLNAGENHVYDVWILIMCQQSYLKVKLNFILIISAMNMTSIYIQNSWLSILAIRLSLQQVHSRAITGIADVWAPLITNISFGICEPFKLML